MDRVEFLKEVQKEKGNEGHDIEILEEENLAKMHSVASYWANIVDEPKERVEEEWDTCNRIWEKINKTMVEL
jgi:hypothetical protein